MTDINIQVQGLDNLDNKVNAIVEKLSNGEFLERVGAKIVNKAKHNANGRPGPMRQSGRLGASLAYKLVDASPVTQMEVGSIVEPVKYSFFVEFGHHQEVGRYVPIFNMTEITKGRSKGRYLVKGLGKRLVKPFAPAYPFLGPAIEEVKTSGNLMGVTDDYARVLEAYWAGI